MSYSLTFNGHGEFASQEDAKAFEESIRDQAREFAANLDGVQTASGSFGTLGMVNLIASGDDEEAAEAAPAESSSADSG